MAFVRLVFVTLYSVVHPVAAVMLLRAIYVREKLLRLDIEIQQDSEDDFALSARP